MYGIIYKATNKINNKVYIGQTIRSLEERIYYHYYRAEHQPEITHTHFVNAIRKYGQGAFSWEIIDQADNKTELDTKEKYWIKYYDSINNGYNMQAGGHLQDTEKFLSACGAKPFYAYRTNGEFLGEFLSCRAFSRQFQVADSHILDVLKHQYNSYCGFIVIYKNEFTEELLEEKLKKAKQSFRPFIAKNLKTQEIFGPFTSMKECKEQLKLKSNHIGEVLKGIRKSQEGYTFYFTDIIDK